jgi:hypothetical protein
MTYLELKEYFKDFVLFSLKDIKKNQELCLVSNFNQINLLFK